MHIPRLLQKPLKADAGASHGYQMSLIRLQYLSLLRLIIFEPIKANTAQQTFSPSSCLTGLVPDILSRNAILPVPLNQQLELILEW